MRFSSRILNARLRVLSERSQNRQVNDSKVRNWLPRVLLKLEGHVLHGFTLIADLVFVRFRESYTTHRCTHCG